MRNLPSITRRLSEISLDILSLETAANPDNLLLECLDKVTRKLLQTEGIGNKAQKKKYKKSKSIKKQWTPCLLIYDAAACTKEEHDPAQAVLYHRPRNASVDTRTAISGQLAGVAHFCRSVFSSPTYIKTQFGHVSMKHYGRFILMVCGSSRTWAESRLETVSQLLDSSTGGISSLWLESSDKDLFYQRLTSLMDAIIFHALPDVNFEDGICSSSSTSSSPSLSCYSALSEGLDETSPEKSSEQSLGGALWRRMISQESEIAKPKPQTKAKPKVCPKIDAEAALANLQRQLSAAPFVPLPKSGASSFLRAQQLLQTCQKHPGVLAGSISYENRVLSSQLGLEMQLVLSSLSGIEKEEMDLLQKFDSSYQLPKDVGLYDLSVPQKTLKEIYKSIPKISIKRLERKGMHNEVQQSSISSLRSALHNHSLQSYTSSIPPTLNNTKPFEGRSSEFTSLKGPLDPLMLCAKISKNGDLLSDGRPSRSLPGSPRKIRVATMLPDVGSNSPELRYKVLTARRQKPSGSTNNSPRRVPTMRNGNVMKSGQNNGILQRGNNLTAPSLKRKDFLSKNDQKVNNGLMDSNSQMNKENINSIDQEFKNGPNNEISVKNTKNKLNLHFAPGKVNRPREDYGEEEKISREINGSQFKDLSSKEIGHKSLTSQLIDMNEDDDESKSEESEISVLELGSYAESKENGNKLFEEATKMDSPKGNYSEDLFENYPQSAQSMYGTNTTEHQRSKVILYVQTKSQMALQLLLDCNYATNEELVSNVYRLASLSLPEIEESLVKTLENSEVKEGDTFLQKSSSALFTVDPLNLDNNLVEAAHQEFLKYPNLKEITFKEDELVLWSHRSYKTETYFQSLGSGRPGLPIPSDTMARIPHRAKRRLERDHGITLL